jgi:hypothetical protein
LCKNPLYMQPRKGIMQNLLFLPAAATQTLPGLIISLWQKIIN